MHTHNQKETHKIERERETHIARDAEMDIGRDRKRVLRGGEMEREMEGQRGRGEIERERGERRESDRKLDTHSDRVV